MISSCTTVTSYSHPPLFIPSQPKLPPFTKELINCGQHIIETFDLCLHINKREILLYDYIETLQILIQQHNKDLADS